MKSFGVVLLVVGIVALLFGVSMDTTVETAFGAIHNIGLMSRQQTIVIFGGALGVVGAILIGFGSRDTKQAGAASDAASAPATSESSSGDGAEEPASERWVLWACGLTLLLILILAMFSSLWDATHR
jgi:hypothetical protein